MINLLSSPRNLRRIGAISVFSLDGLGLEYAEFRSLGVAMRHGDVEPAGGGNEVRGPLARGRADLARDAVAVGARWATTVIRPSPPVT